MRRKWWAWQGLNLRPLRCQHSALPLSYTPTRRLPRWPQPEAQPRLEAAVLIFGLEDAVDLED